MSGQNAGPRSATASASASGTTSALPAAENGGGGLLATRGFWAGYGVAMAVMGVRLPMWSWPPQTDQVVVLLFATVIFAALAQPYTGRPVLASMRMHHMALAHRNTLLVGAFVILVAVGKPQAWAAGVDALLLAGYLVLTDALTVPPRVLKRIASPAFLIALVAVIAGATALVALPAADDAYRPILVAVAGAAALGAAMATAFGSAEERRVGSRRTEHQNQDRSSE
ncbi:hypothetical protein ABIA35_003571 [Catenulispora sp. MAP12-49]|uniref:hypothetical protein n=1 Tax=Catenulispora sp. MAP12-49 TaxID=3156302 RepID=UPI0035123B1B